MNWGNDDVDADDADWNDETVSVVLYDERSVNLDQGSDIGMVGKRQYAAVQGVPQDKINVRSLESEPLYVYVDELFIEDIGIEYVDPQRSTIRQVSEKFSFFNSVAIAVHNTVRVTSNDISDFIYYPTHYLENSLVRDFDQAFVSEIGVEISQRDYLSFKNPFEIMTKGGKPRFVNSTKFTSDRNGVELIERDYPDLEGCYRE